MGYFGGIGAASRRGILLKGSSVIDMLASVKTIVFDKTGTLTRGEFKVQSIIPRNNFSSESIIRYAALAESHSSHPIADAITKEYNQLVDDSLVSEYNDYQGYGIGATVNNKSILVGNDALLHKENIPHEDCDIDLTVAYVAVDGVYAGHIIIADTIKEGAADALNRLRSCGVENLVMLTGDSKGVAKHVAEELQIDSWHAELLPEDKVLLFEKTAEQHSGNTAFVGDGINDAPVITRADVGIAMGALGSDAAIETADMVLMTDDLSRIADAVLTSRRTRRIVIQNIALALVIKTGFIVLGITGISGMWEAVFADMGVTLLAILNSLRVLRVGKK